ncbi:MAG: hypothetical protein RL617_1282 [Pseudomonadota bacterium]|jgi:BolA protein
MSLSEELERRLQAALAPQCLEVWDESKDHVGHTGAPKGAGHFHVLIVSELFAQKSRLARHRLVYDAVTDLMPHRVHALSIQALTPSESP